jgi:hypothetical protein
VIAGIRAQAQPTTLMNAAFVGACLRSRDDSAENKYNIDGMVSKAGRMGTILPTLGANRNSHAYITPANPLAVNNFSSIQGALGVSGSLDALSSNQKSRLFRMVERLNSLQSRRIASNSGGQELAQLLQCASVGNSELISSEDPGVNPLADAAFSNIWGIDANTNKGSREFVAASVVYNTIKGNSTTANITMGGYDYHNGTRATGDARDNEAGQMMGRILQSFAAMNSKGFLVVYTDGGVAAPVSELPGAPWTSDRGGAGMAYFMAYNPISAPSASGFQLGHFNAGQTADEKFITGGSAELTAAAIFANYLSFSGQLGQLEKVIPRVFTSSDLAKVIKVS